MPSCMLDFGNRLAYHPLNDAHSERGGLLDSGSAQISLQKAKATAASGKGEYTTDFLLCIGATLKFI